MKRHPIGIILFTILIDTLGIGILGPILPQLLGNPNSPHYLLGKDATVGSGYIMFGFLVASFPVMQFFSTPILGQLSDRYGRKPVLALSLAGTALGYLLFATGIVIKSIPLLFVARALDGITGGNLSVAQAAIADVTPPSERTKNFGLIGAAFGVGFIVGPFLGGVLADPSVLSWFTAATPFWFAALLASANTAQVLLQFDETNKHIRDVSVDFTKGIGNIVRAYGMRELRPIFMTSFFFNAGFGFFISFFGVFLIHRFNFNEARIGNFFAWVGVCAIFTQVFTTRRIAARRRVGRHDRVPAGAVSALAIPDCAHQLDVQRAVAREHGRAAQPIRGAAGAGRNPRHRIEHRGARELAAAAHRRLRRGVVRARGAGAGRGAHDVSGVADLYADLPPGAGARSGGHRRVATRKPPRVWASRRVRGWLA